MDEEQLNDVELEDEANIITLEAEGEAVEFEYIDTLDYEGEEYVVLKVNKLDLARKNRGV